MDYSVIIPAHDEEHFLPATLAALASAMQATPGLGEVIVVDNDSTDRTAELASQAGARVMHEPVRQIARARNTGARHATGRFLVFLDADTLLTAGLLQRALETLQGGAVCVGGTTVKFGGRESHLLLRIWNRIATRFSLAAGCFIFTLAEAHAGIGGFDEAYYASEEIWYVRKLKRWGKQRNMGALIFDDQPITTSDRKIKMYKSWEILGFMLLNAIPFSLRSRRMCGMWYGRRPKL